MKNLSSFCATACAVTIVSMLAATATRAEEPTTASAPVRAATPAENPQMFDRDGRRIVGFELMSETEVSGYRALLFSIKDPVARDQARSEHRKAMEKRAAERGVKLQE